MRAYIIFNPIASERHGEHWLFVADELTVSGRGLDVVTRHKDKFVYIDRVAQCVGCRGFWGFGIGEGGAFSCQKPVYAAAFKLFDFF